MDSRKSVRAFSAYLILQIQHLGIPAIGVLHFILSFFIIPKYAAASTEWVKYRLVCHFLNYSKANRWFCYFFGKEGTCGMKQGKL